jgi:hypothetical protein
VRKKNVRQGRADIFYLQLIFNVPFAASLEDHRCGAADRSLVLRHYFGSARDQGGGGRWISQQISNRGNQGVRRMKLDNPSGLTEFLHDVSKIFHVRTHHDGFVCQDRFHRVLAADSIKAFADDDDSGRRIPVPEFSGGVYQQHGRMMLEIRFGT